jgi:UDP-N-acetylmuramate--alanine ligase
LSKWEKNAVALLLSLDEGLRQVAAVRGLLEQPSRHVHLLGASGFGMAGVAVHLAGRGLRVSGCDLSPNRISEWLQAQGIPVLVGHAASHMAGVDWAVRSTAIPADAPELGEAARKGIPVFARGAVLPALLAERVSVAVSGTHGKTTTSAMIAQVLAAAGERPGFCIGGEVAALGGVAAAGDGRHLVVEADESDGTVMLYEPDVAVITNIEYDHMEHFESEDLLVRCFETFARNARRRVIYCADDPRAAAVCGHLPNARSYGFSEAADIRAADVEEGAEQIAMSVVHRGGPLAQIRLPVGGLHNALNALGALAAAMELGLSPETAAEGLARFVPVRRRFEKVWDRDDVLVVSDYAHHPTEIRALVRTTLKLGRRVIGIFQPHRYTRTRALGADFPPAFEGLSELVLVPVYAASEAPIEGGTAEDLFARFRSFGRVPARYTASLTAAWDYVRTALRRGDVLLVIGAGDVEQLAWRARAELEKGDLRIP